jgi:hypothetical protein
MPSAPQSGSEEPFRAAYRAYLESMKQAWADVDIDEMVSAHHDLKFAYQSAGSVSTVGTVWCLACYPATLGTVGTLGTVASQPQ